MVSGPALTPGSGDANTAIPANSSVAGEGSPMTISVESAAIELSRDRLGDIQSVSGSCSVEVWDVGNCDRELGRL